MVLFFLIIGTALAIIDIFYKINTLKQNIIRRLVFIFLGIVSVYFVDKTYLKLTFRSLIYGILVGVFFLLLHIIIAKGIKLKIKEIDKGLVYTSLLIYILELPGEEFLYRGIIFISLMKIFNPILAILITSILFLGLHFKTWSNKKIWIGSLVLGLVCATSVYLTNSIWTAIFIHNLNDFGFLTLINKRNIFIK
ncbi:MAG: CPBP family intramembrane metalloprotease [Firmicutes bacterium]|nr:CPBP family intramembrane metalloprotease [Bacillota bacterium]